MLNSPSNKTNLQFKMKKGKFSKKMAIRCMFCKGVHCKQCGTTAHLCLANPAIENIHSAWITDQILAMQRPSDSMLIEGKVLDSFIAQKITAVFNLTEPGEHPYCGCGILESTGFPYTPELLMGAGIKHFNYSWPDMTVPSLRLMLDIVNIACNELSVGKKISVHCHAGFGRTGLTIACILIAKDKIESDQAIRFIRIRRPGSIQTQKQENFIKRFEIFYQTMLSIFPSSTLSERIRSIPIQNKIVQNDPTITNNNFITEFIHSALTSTSSSSQRSPTDLLYVPNYKSISASIRDQQYTLNTDEVMTNKYKYTSKLLSIILENLIQTIHAHIHTVCLIITGLSKFVIKPSGWEVEDSNIRMTNDRIESNNGPSTFTLRSPSYMKLLADTKYVKSYLIVLGSYAESLESNLLREIKIELNENKWVKFNSIQGILCVDWIDNKLSMGIRNNTESYSQSQSSIDTKSNLQSPFLSHSSTERVLVNPVDHNDEVQPFSVQFLSPTEKKTFFKSDQNYSQGLLTTDPLSTQSIDEDDDNIKMMPLVTIRSRANSHEESITWKDTALERETMVYAPIRKMSGTDPSSTVAALAGALAANFAERAYAETLENGSPQKSFQNESNQKVLDEKKTELKSSIQTIPKKLKSVRSQSFKSSKSLLNRQLSEADVNRTRRVSIVVMIQLFFDWIETRETAILSSEAIQALCAQWNISIGNYINVKSNALSPNSSNHPSTAENSFDKNSSGELIIAIENILMTYLDRYQLSLLSQIIDLYREVRTCGKNVLENDSTDDFSPLDTLVGLRLAIACMLGIKNNSNLISKQRSLSMDLVKIFLRKHTKSGKVIINNITVADENDKMIRNNIGVDVVNVLEIILQTLQILLENHWSYSYTPTKYLSKRMNELV